MVKGMASFPDKIQFVSVTVCFRCSTINSVSGLLRLCQTEWDSAAVDGRWSHWPAAAHSFECQPRGCAVCSSRFSHKEKLIQHETNVTSCALLLNVVCTVTADPNFVFIRLYLRKML